MRSTTWVWCGISMFFIMVSSSAVGQNNNCSGLRIRYDERYANNAAKCGTPSSVTFRNRSYGNKAGISKYRWYINDSLIGQSTGLANINFSYADTGVYNLKIVATDTTNNCVDSMERNFLVFNKPSPTANSSTDTVCAGSVVYFHPTVQDSWRYAQYYWRFPDNSNSTSANSSFLFTNTGRNRVRLRVRNTNQCETWVNKYIWVNPSNNQMRLNDLNGNPSSNPTWQNCILAAGTVDTFQLILSTPDSIFNYQIDFGDGNTLSGTNDTFYQGQALYHTYQNLGTYDFVMTGEDRNGCERELRGTVINERIPTSGIIGPPSGNQSGCAPLAVRFINSSYNISNSTTFTWTYGDGQSDLFTSSNSGDTIWHTYQKDAADCNLEVTLTAENACGTSIATWAYVNVFDEDDISLSANNGYICQPDSTVTLTLNIDRNCILGQRFYYWDFGDGRNRGWTTSAAPRTVVYNTPGTYQVFAIDSNPCGSDTAYYTVTVRAPILAGFTNGFVVGNANNCAPVTVSVSDTSSGVANSRTWSFGDGTTSTAASPSHTYTTSGAFTLSLSKGNECETKTASTVINVYDKPDARIATIDSTCVPATIQFTNQTSRYSPNATFLWTLPDNSTSTAVSPPNMTLNTSGDYTVTLVVNDSCGSDTVVQNFRVLGYPSVDFTAPGACQGNTTAFNNNSTIDANDGSISDYTWRFGDGTISTQSSPSHVYASNGTYAVTLIAESRAGCIDSATKNIKVFEQPVLSLSESAALHCIGSSIRFAATANLNSATLDTLEWSFGDGATDDDSLIVNHSYASSGTFNAQLFVRTSDGCTNTKGLTININPTPTAVTQIDSVCLGDSTLFEDNSLKVVSRQWDFDLNGSTDATTDSLRHRFSSAGANKATLRLTSDSGCISFDTVNATVFSLPNAAWTATNDSFCKSTPIAFQNGSTGGDTFYWNFNNGLPIQKTTSTNTFSRSFSNIGSQPISIQAISGKGCVDSFNSTLQIIEHPTALFSFQDSAGCAPFTISVLNTSNNASAFDWYVDGNLVGNSLQLNSRVIQQASDSVEIALVAHNALRCKSDTFRRIFFTHVAPKAGFTKSVSSGCGPLSVSFTNTSSQSSTYLWNFGNGGTSTLSTPSSSFSSSLFQDTTYYLSLVSTSIKGCKDTTRDSVKVYPLPRAKFITNQHQGCGPLAVQITNQSEPMDTGSIRDMTFSWSFGNGLSSTVRDTAVSFAPSNYQDTNYTVELKAYSEHGCLATTSKNIKVFPIPLVDFSVSALEGCHPLAVSAINQSSPKDTGTVNDMNFSWSVLSSTNTLKNQNLAFNNTGVVDSTYVVKLQGTSEHGCIDSIQKSVVVHPNPVAQLATSDSIFCKRDAVSIQNLSSLTDTSYVNYGDALKNFQLMGTPTSQKKYKFSGNFSITLRAETRYGCEDRDTLNVRIIEWPEANFSSVDTIGCAPMSFSFSNRSRYADSFEWVKNGASLAKTSALGTQSISSPSDSFVLELVASNRVGCHTDTARRVYRTFRAPGIDFSADTNSGCGNTSIKFRNKTSYFSRVAWDFGDGSGSIKVHPKHTFQASKSQDTSFVVKLTTITRDFCLDSLTDTIRLYPIPVAQFTPTISSGCGPLAVQFTNSSFPKDTGSINDMSFAWDLGNGSSSSQMHPGSTFTSSLSQDSLYTVKLKAYSEHGCVDSARQQIKVFPDPTVRFSPSSLAGCHPFKPSFTNQSSPNDTGSISIMSFQWTSNGSQSIKRHLQDSFYNSGTIPVNYKVGLVGYSEHGCMGSTDTTLTVYPRPTAAFTLSSDSACRTDSFRLNNSSIVADSFVINWGNSGISKVKHQRPVAFAFNTSAQHTIKLEAFNSYGCRNEVSDVFTAIPWPKAKFRSADTIGCAPMSFSFTNTSANAVSYEWLKNGVSLAKTSTLASQSLSATSDSFVLQLVANNALGCHTDTARRKYRTFRAADIDFAPDTSSGCGNTAIKFTNKTGYFSRATWDFGDGSGSIKTHPRHIFQASASQDTSFVIKLRVTTPNFCQDSLQDTIRLFPIPKAQFAANVSNGCGPLAVQFTNSSFPRDTGSINDMSFAWDFGNGSTSSQMHPGSTYTSSLIQDSIYTVKLMAYSEHGCVDSTREQVTVFPNPTVKFKPLSLNGCHPLKTSFLNQSSPNDTGSIAIMKFEWTSNGSQKATPFLQDSFANTGSLPMNYKVGLVGYSEHGCVDSIDTTLTVFPNPKVTFTLSSDSACRADSVVLSNLSTVADSFVIHWGSSALSKLNNQSPVSYAFSTSATHTIRLQAFNSYGCRNEVSHVFTAIEWPRAAITSSHRNGCAPQQFTFQNNSQNAVRYKWMKDGSTISSTSGVPSQGISLPQDSIRLQLVANNALGCHADTANVLVFTHADPKAVFSEDTLDGCGPLTVNFTSNSTLAFAEVWDFENGSTAFGTKAKQVFAASKVKDSTHSVKLVVTSLHGCKDSLSKTVKVYPNPTANFQSSLIDGCSPLPVSFQNLSVPNDTGSISDMKFSWNFQNGQISSLQSASTQFGASKTRDTIYEVKLLAFSEHGCRDSIVKNITVFPQPTLSVFPSVKHGCGPLPVQFINLSKPNDISSILDMSFEWDFGNGASGTGIQQSSTFLQPKFQDTTYQVRIIGKTEHQCVDTIHVPITVHPDPTVAFKPSKISGCSPLKVSFMNNSSPNDTGGLATMEFIWDLENGIKSRSKNPDYTYHNFGKRDSSYKVQLVAFSKWGCRDTVAQTLTVQYLPKADFNTNEMFACSPFQLKTENRSKQAKRYQWWMGNSYEAGTQNLSTNLTSGFKKDSLFRVKLIAFTENGCRDSSSRNVRVYRQVKAKFDAGYVGCTPYEAVFTDRSTNAVIHFWDMGDGTYSNHESPQHLYTKEGVYKVQLKVIDITGCTDSTELPNAVSLSKTPDARITLDTMQNELPNAKFVMQPTVWVSDGTVDYEWKSDGQLTSVTPLNTYTFQSKGEKKIQLLAKTDFCQDSSIKTVDVLLPIPTPGFYSDLNNGCVELPVSFTDTSEWAENVEWFFGDGRSSKKRNPTHTYKLPGKYKVTQRVTNERGQNFVTVDDYIEVYPLPFVDFDPTPKLVFLPDADVTFNNLSFNAVSYEWYKNEVFFSQDTTPTYRFTEEGDFDITLVGYSDKGCKDSITHLNKVKVKAQGEVYIPNAFSPNQDGRNEGFRPVGYGIEADEYRLKIFNRWGEKVFETIERDEEWDGTFRGNKCEPGVFVWVLELKFAHGEVRNEAGNVTLIR